jgi:thiol-disulfide isomerase/thioredoxin
MMARYLFTVLLILPALTLFSQDIEVIGIDRLKKELSQQSDTVYVFNFWATWCKPCTEEMPDLLKVEKEYTNHKMKLILISLDMPSQKDTRLVKFINEYKISSEVLLLDDPDFNKWIPIVDDSWTGSIPATLIYAPGKDYRKFHEGVISYPELKSQVQSLIQ